MKTGKSAAIFARVEEWRQSGQSLREFAKTIGMSKSHHQVCSDVSIEMTFPGGAMEFDYNTKTHQLYQLLPQFIDSSVLC